MKITSIMEKIRSGKLSTEQLKMMKAEISKELATRRRAMLAEHR